MPPLRCTRVLARVDPAPAVLRYPLSRAAALAAAGVLWLAFAAWGLSVAARTPPSTGSPLGDLLSYFLVALLLLFPSVGLLVCALNGFIAWRRCALAWELARWLRLTGRVLVLPEEVEYEVGLVEQLEYNYSFPRRVYHDVKGGFKPVARGESRAVELPGVPIFIAIRKAGVVFYWRGSDGYLRAPAIRILSGRYKGFYVLLLEPGSAMRSVTVDGARAVYRSSPQGSSLELEWRGGGGVVAEATLRLKTGMWRRSYVVVAELYLREPGATRFTVEWRGAKIIVLPELRLDSLRRALGAEAVFAGDPAGTPAELEVTVYGLLGKRSWVAPLG
jgi:hypothetical protein